MAEVSRRAFLFGGVALASGVAACSVPDGPQLPQPQALSEPYELVATPSGYSGQFPGPLLKVREGDRVQLAFRNGLDAPTSLHIHGLPLSPAVDAPLTHLKPGESDHRDFTIPPGTAGTYWYHPHAHGDVERQLLMGLAGPIVVDDGRIDADDRLVMITKDLQVNGVARPVITPRSGRVRLRLINATAADTLLLGVLRDGDQQTFHLIATDGGLVENPVPLTEILLTPGERAEILVDTTTAGRLELRALPYSVYGPGGAQSEDRLLASLDVPAGLVPIPLPWSMRKIDAPTGSRTRRLVLNGHGDSMFTINGRTFDHNRVDMEVKSGTTEIWELVNEHTMDHPFHLHSYSFQVVDAPFRAWRDTVNVPPGSTVRIVIPFHGPPGRTVYHCHIASHEDLGMMGILEVT
ncbi:multicopper oxidase family protein [Kibdelosporangium aridum]|uniref:Multicopper oxidase with three cupredoxin domains (Includes cell division protein FtsP and spore coat protein CotA) n=1 Tax=Kibdelosporangium aridum TaxID=2030 RepID=A0A1Y5Y7G7_KIBAR|nr:multicopper oxidase family protein [Kibdelosporangium aridum]SMD25620.1 Multicopper oxidase with three cupredoxin domains (includes cell division protein FtsP and spore coat protein CotA) [Kibdelosporangium aridum]